MNRLGSIRPSRLKVQALQLPLGLPGGTPLLRWEISAAPAIPPSRCHIQVADSPEAFSDNRLLKWDSGWVETNLNELKYEGSPSTSRERLYWKVRVATAEGGVSKWSEPGWWEYGLLQREDWSAKWITTDLIGGPRTGAPAAHLRKSFSLNSPPNCARLYITSLGLYHCELNGAPVTDAVFVPGWTEYKKRVQVQTYDVTGLLHAGENAVGVILGDGWYCGHIAVEHRQYYGRQPVLLAQLEIELADGTSVRIITDEQWKYSSGPILQNDLLMGESYDARLNLGKWSSPGYNDALWRSTFVNVPPSIAWEASASPPVRRHERFPVKEPIRTRSEKRVTEIFDLRQNISGRVKITVRGSPGSHFQLRFAEALTATGDVYLENLRTAVCTDQYTCQGTAEEVWEPQFTFHGFRYVEIQYPNVNDDPEATILSVEGIALYSDMEETGTFSCSNQLLNKLFENMRWSMRGNFLEVPTDCPQRDERLGYTGDAQVFISTASFLYDTQGFFNKWFLDIEDAQKDDGRIAPVAPHVTSWRGGPGWSDAAVICPWEVYRTYGEVDVLARNYSVMKRFVEHMRVHRCKDNIRSHPDVDPWGGHGDWLALDGSEGREGNTAKDLIGTAFLAYDLEVIARIAHILKQDHDAKLYLAWRSDVIEAFQKRFLSKGTFTNRTQTAYILSLSFGLLPMNLRPTVARDLVDDIQKRDFHLSTGFIGTPYICQVLEDNGYLDVAYRLIEQETFPSWLFPVKQGATTIWERWDGWTPEIGFQDSQMNSFNHYAYGAVGAWMIRAIAGLEMDAEMPGGSHMYIRPRPGGTITAAQAQWHTPRGLASISWRKTSEKLKIDFRVPPYSTATFLPPKDYSSEIQHFSAGSHSLQLEPPQYDV
jgi:alpha-L-rhamnosidase